MHPFELFFVQKLLFRISGAVESVCSFRFDGNIIVFFSGLTVQRQIATNGYAESFNIVDFDQSVPLVPCTDERVLRQVLRFLRIKRDAKAHTEYLVL